MVGSTVETHFETDEDKFLINAKSNNSKECIVGYYWFFNRGFKYQDSVGNVCHYLLMLCVYISDIAIITVKSADYHCIIYGISKSAAIIS